MTSGFDIQFDPEGYLLVVARGPCEATTVERLRGDLDDHLQGRTQPDLVIDLRGLTRFDTGLRRSLAQLQADLACLVGRTAYVTDRPRLRAFARWVCRVGEDPDANAVCNLDEARRWLDRNEDRLAVKGRHLRLRLYRLFTRPPSRERLR